MFLSFFLFFKAKISPGCSGPEAQEVRMDVACILKGQVSLRRKIPFIHKVRENGDRENGVSAEASNHGTSTSSCWCGEEPQVIRAAGTGQTDGAWGSGRLWERRSVQEPRPGQEGES